MSLPPFGVVSATTSNCPTCLANWIEFQIERDDSATIYCVNGTATKPLRIHPRPCSDRLGPPDYIAPEMARRVTVGMRRT